MLILLNSLRTTTSNAQHPVRTTHKQMDKHKEQTVKRLLVKAKDPYKALLDYRNRPLDTERSPAQLFLGRRLKTTLPTTFKLIQPGHGSSEEYDRDMVNRQEKRKFYIEIRKRVGTCRRLEPAIQSR